MSAGRWSVGAVVSCTVTVNVAVAVLPAWSVAVQVTVLPPRGNVAPDGGWQSTATAPSTRSLAVGGPDGRGAAWPSVASIVRLDGTSLNDGFVVSVTVTSSCASAVLPA